MVTSGNSNMKRAKRSRRRAAAASGLLILLAVTLAACGSSSSSSGSSSDSSSSSSAGEAKGSGLPQAEKRLAELYRGVGYAKPEAGPKPTPGQSVWIISLAQNIPSAATASAAAVEAGKLLGWETTIVDGKANSNTILNGIREAIVAKADAIALIFIDCPTVKGGLEEARRAGVKVVADESLDCNEIKPGAESLFDYVTTYYENKSVVEFFEEWAAARAVWGIVATEGEAKTLEVFTSDAYLSAPVKTGYARELATCGSCEVVGTVDVTAAEFGPPLQQKVQEGLLKYPEANTINLIGDSVLTTGGAAAIRQSGRLGSFKAAGGEGSPAGMQLIREEEGMDAAFGPPLEWEAYAMMQGANDLLSGDSTELDTGIGIQAVDREHNLPPSGGFVPPIDFVAAYEAMWR